MTNVKVVQWVICPECKNEVKLKQFSSGQIKQCECGSSFVDRHGHIFIKNYYEKGG